MFRLGSYHHTVCTKDMLNGQKGKSWSLSQYCRNSGLPRHVMKSNWSDHSNTLDRAIQGIVNTITMKHRGQKCSSICPMHDQLHCLHTQYSKVFDREQCPKWSVHTPQGHEVWPTLDYFLTKHKNFCIFLFNVLVTNSSTHVGWALFSFILSWYLILSPAGGHIVDSASGKRTNP